MEHLLNACNAVYNLVTSPFSDPLEQFKHSVEVFSLFLVLFLIMASGSSYLLRLSFEDVSDDEFYLEDELNEARAEYNRRAGEFHTNQSKLHLLHLQLVQLTESMKRTEDPKRASELVEQFNEIHLEYDEVYGIANGHLHFLQDIFKRYGQALMINS